MKIIMILMMCVIVMALVGTSYAIDLHNVRDGICETSTNVEEPNIFRQMFGVEEKQEPTEVNIFKQMFRGDC
jgi:hypothetical protein